MKSISGLLVDISGSCKVFSRLSQHKCEESGKQCADSLWCEGMLC